jgi:ribosome-binding ATPase YchF (GTP1/OBG family)
VPKKKSPRSNPRTSPTGPARTSPRSSPKKTAARTAEEIAELVRAEVTKDGAIAIGDLASDDVQSRVIDWISTQSLEIDAALWAPGIPCGRITEGFGSNHAGKSTLLTAISHARPKIAPYPFTTLHPQIGIVEYSDFFRLTVCDVPGLIEGAHRNVGLGHQFLRHIERCKVLVLLLDMAGTDNRPPWEDYQNLLKELELYDPSLLERPRLVVANKMDELAAEENLKKFKRRIRKTPVLPIAAAFDEGIDKFKKVIREAVEEAAEDPKAVKKL